MMWDFIIKCFMGIPIAHDDFYIKKGVEPQPHNGKPKTLPHKLKFIETKVENLLFSSCGKHALSVYLHLQSRLWRFLELLGHLCEIYLLQNLQKKTKRKHWAKIWDDSFDAFRAWHKTYSNFLKIELATIKINTILSSADSNGINILNVSLEIKKLIIFFFNF